MSNELTPESTIVALYAEIKRLEAELIDNSNFIIRLQKYDHAFRLGFKKWAYHLPECISQFTKEHKDCDCGLKEFIEGMKIE